MLVVVIFEVISSQQSAIIRYYSRALLLARNNGLIRAPIIAENDGFFIRRRYAIPEYPTDVFGAITAGRDDDFSRQGTTTHPPPAQESFCTQQVVASLQGVGGHSPVLLTKHSMFGARPPNVRSIPRILDLY